MRRAGVAPDEITYLCLLSACVHGGLVDEAWEFFRSLEAQGLRPHVEHYACLVDVLGRAGHLEEVYGVVKSMPMKPSVSVLGALLNACHLHGWVELSSCSQTMMAGTLACPISMLLQDGGKRRRKLER